MEDEGRLLKKLLKEISFITRPPDIKKIIIKSKCYYGGAEI